jgi:hypothetical protein
MLLRPSSIMIKILHVRIYVKEGAKEDCGRWGGGEGVGGGGGREKWVGWERGCMHSIMPAVPVLGLKVMLLRSDSIAFMLNLAIGASPKQLSGGTCQREEEQRRADAMWAERGNGGGIGKFEGMSGRD